MTQKEFTDKIGIHTTSLTSNAMKFTRDLDDANDLVQDTLLKATRFIHRFKDGTNIKGWLFVIMKNTFINDYKKNLRKRTLVIQDEYITSENLVFSASANNSTSDFILKDIHSALAHLPEKYSFPFIRYFEGFKYHEIALEMEVPIGTVKTYIHEARIHLKKYLKQYRSRP